MLLSNFFNGHCYFKKDIFRHTTEHINIFVITHYFEFIYIYIYFYPGLFLKQTISVGKHNISSFRDEKKTIYTILFLSLRCRITEDFYGKK